MTGFDLFLALTFIFGVVAYGMYRGRHRVGAESYFLAGRSLSWPVIGLSLIAANISTEQFVGMNGAGAGEAGLAIASYSWIASVTLVMVAIFFLPLLLRLGVTTIPQFLERRYNVQARTIMSGLMIFIYVFVTIPSVAFSGGLALSTLLDWDLAIAVWIIGIIACIYTTYGGLKSVATADVFFCTGLLLGGAAVAVLSFNAVGGIEPLMAESGHKFHMALPQSSMVIPVSALLLGIWIPNLYYWGFNQYIVQRSLAARTVKDGQLGVLLAAGIQVILPLMIVVPGIIAAQIFADRLESPDQAFPMLIRELVPAGLRGLIFAAIVGAIISSLSSMFNSASTIFSIDIYRRFRKGVDDADVVRTGRYAVVVFMIIGCLVGIQIVNFGAGVFHFIQEFQGFVTVGILAVFIFGFFVPKTRARTAIVGMCLNPVVYGILFVLNNLGILEIAFLNRIAMSFIVIVAVMAAMVFAERKTTTPFVFDFADKPAHHTPASVKVIGAVIVAIIAVIYIVFW